MTYIYYQDTKGEWRWRLRSSSGRILADSGEGYKNLNDCLEDIDRVKASDRCAGEEGIGRVSLQHQPRAGLTPCPHF